MRVEPFLMFTGEAEEAMRFYVALFPDAAIERIDRRADDGSGAPGTVQHARFRIGNLVIRCIDSPPVHDFTFTPSTSLFVTVDDAAEVDRLAGALAEQGQVLMPVGAYPFSPRYGWVSDRFGVSWQVGLDPG